MTSSSPIPDSDSQTARPDSTPVTQRGESATPVDIADASVGPEDTASSRQINPEAPVSQDTPPTHPTAQSSGQYLDVPGSTQGPQRRPSPSADSSYSDLIPYRDDPAEESRAGEPVSSPAPPSPGPYLVSGSPRPKISWQQRVKHTWLQSKGLVMVMVAQFFGASMNVMTRILELEGPHGKAMHPFEILFVRMSATMVISSLYMWYKKVPDPFGVPAVRGLLILRGVSGFFGVFGLYYSLVYLPLSEATVLTFLIPILTCYVCSIVMPNETFTRKQQLAGIVSLVGVVLIARPFALWTDAPSSGSSPEGTPIYTNDTISTTSATFTFSLANPDLKNHLIATGAALLGVCGATLAYTSIRKIGQRAHPLISVNYFSVLTTIISMIAVCLPSVSFRLPANIPELLLLIGLGTCGFILQFLLTAGLAYVPPPSPSEKGVEAENSSGGSSSSKGKSTHGSRATSMVYTQMLFALFYDKVVWNSTPSPTSWAGSGIILASAIYVAVARDGGASKKVDGEEGSGTDTTTTLAEDDEDEGEVDVESGLGQRRRAKAVYRDHDEFEAASEEERRGLLNGHDDSDSDGEDGFENERSGRRH